MKNSIAGYLSPDGYVRIAIKNKNYLANRLAWLYVKGYFPEQQVDHENRVRNDNRWKNLRESSQSCNMINCGIRKDNTSGVVGVAWLKRDKIWKAYISFNKKRIQLGTFKKKKEAVLTRWKAEVKYDYLKCNSSSTSFSYLKKRGLIL